MDPFVLISNSQPPKNLPKLFNKIILTTSVIVIILLATLSIFLLFKYSNKLTIFNKKVATPKLTTPLNPKEDLEQTIKLTFKDPKDQDIVKYISFASKDRTLETKFIDYSKAYQLIYQRYSNTQNTQIKIALVKLNTFLKAFPQFKEANFKLIK